MTKVKGCLEEGGVRLGREGANTQVSKAGGGCGYKR